MSDIVSTFRSYATDKDNIPRMGSEVIPTQVCLLLEAADIITSLREEVERLRAGLDREPTEAEVADACLTYRHDFGLLSVVERTMLASQAKWWLDAWQKAFARSLTTHMGRGR